MNDGLILPINSQLQPYLFAGTGFANTFMDMQGANIPGLDWTVNIGFGINYKVNDYFSVNYNTNWAITNNDKRDGKIIGAFNDMFMIHSVGIVFPIGKISDLDKDGVRDIKDACPNTPLGIPVDKLGCPFDQDADGIADYLDRCYDKFGSIAAFGCPDTDDDGIPDGEDECPEIAGPKETNGCPDRDEDGTLDKEDECPDVKGLKTLNGCPDKDGDGIIDSKDKCPKLAGTIANNGCPEIEEAIKNVFEKALKGIQFETGKSIIKNSSYTIMDEVVQILFTNSSYNLDINGHTDNQGDKIKNLELSKERALAVKLYLIQKGIVSSRIRSEGFGATQPKTSNETAEGRSVNRRVEFIIRFEE
jgi:outer membrane protein OmpA-like peptidoglycan-associated protein